MQKRRVESKELDLILSEIQGALDRIKEKYNLASLSLGATRYNAFSFTSKVEGKIDNQLENDFKYHEAEYFAQINGLPPDFINRKFKSGGLSFTIIKLETRNSKYPIIAYCKENDKDYKFTVETIKKILNT